jgi:hypothetical protein
MLSLESRIERQKPCQDRWPQAQLIITGSDYSFTLTCQFCFATFYLLFSGFDFYAYKKVIVTGSEVMAARICVRGEPMADYTEQKCNELCEKKYGGDPKKQGGSRGHCVVSGTCSCTFDRDPRLH